MSGFDRLKAFLGRDLTAHAANAPSYVRQAPLYTPSSLRMYARPMGSSVGIECARCNAPSEHWICRVYADRLEVRLCRACWKEWDARVKGRAA